MDEPPSLRPGFGRRLADLARDTAGEGLLTLGPDGRVVTADARAGQLLGRPPEELVGTPVGDLAAPGSVAALRRPWAGTRDELEVLARDGRGGSVVLVARVRPLVVDGVDVLAAFLRLPERAARRFDRELGRLVAARAEALVAVVRIDNRHDLADALGHEEVARIVDGLAARMRALLPAGATSRPASDELAVAVDAAVAGRAEELGRRLVAELGEPVDVGGVRLAVEVSAGIAAHPRDGASPATLLRRARQAAHAARSERSGFACWSTGMEHGGPPRAQVVAEFARALDAGDVAFAYQPQLDLQSGRIVAAEALVRWRHPERGLLAPAAFLPAVERSPLMRRLALAALEDAVVQAARWETAGLALSASVNLSVLNLLDLGIAHDLARLLARHGVAPGRLTLELTEDAIMVDPARAAGVLGGLHAMGVGLAIDDFGTGYSSLAYLQRLPVHELKIDRSFVRRVADDPRDAAIVGSIVELARGLGLRSVAEGVETADQQRVVRAAGCTTVQGYLVGRPMPAEDVGALAAASRRPRAPGAR